MSERLAGRLVIKVACRKNWSGRLAGRLTVREACSKPSRKVWWSKVLVHWYRVSSKGKGGEERDNETRLEFVGRGKMKIYGWEEV